MPNTRKNPRDPDSPFVTREGMRRAIRFTDRFPQFDVENVAAAPLEEMEEVRLRLSKDVVEKLRAVGSDPSPVVDQILRSGLERYKKIAA